MIKKKKNRENNRFLNLFKMTPFIISSTKNYFLKVFNNRIPTIPKG